MQYGYWKVRVIQKHRLPASWRHLVPGIFVSALILCLLTAALGYLLAAIFHLPLAMFRLPFFTLCFLLSAYTFAALAASLDTASKAGWKLLPVLPMVFGCYHFGYGYGFLRGVWDFLIRRRGPQNAFQRLTR
jgi:succinoglycan biosynthesis protein ExoA